MTRLSIIFFFLIFGKINTEIKRIDKYKADIDEKLKEKKLVAKDNPNMSSLGGAVTGYYWNKKLVLITTTYGAPFGYQSKDFYIMRDSLVFVEEHERFYKEPKDLVTYKKKHTDKKGNVDMSNLPLEKSEDNIYYFSDETIISFQLKEFGKPKKAMEDEIAKKNTLLIEHYRTHLRELK